MMEEVLIRAVFRRRPLWDPRHDLHRHPAVLRREWEEVAKETGKDGEFIGLLSKSIFFFVKGPAADATDASQH